jgi:hypothetical protein
VQAGDLAKLAVTGIPASVPAGSLVTFTVTAEDVFGNPITGYAGTVTFDSTDPQATLPQDYTFQPNSDHGSHSFRAVVFTAGTRSITATDTANASLTGSETFTVTPAAASQIVLTAPSTVTAGSPFSLTVTVQDAYGNTATGYTGTVHFTASNGQMAQYTFKPADMGTITVPNLVLTHAGPLTVTATDTVTSSITGSTSLTVTPAAANHFGVTGYPSPSVAGAGGTVTVTALDPYGNTDVNYTGTVHLSSDDPLAQFDPDHTFGPGDAGVAQFGATLFTAGTRSITATDTVTASITGSQTGIVITPAAADHFTVTAPPTATAGTPTSAVVTVQDVYGNTVVNYTGTVVLSSSDPQAMLPGPYTFTTADAGVHTFANVILKTAGTQSVTADDFALPLHGVSNPIQVSAAAAARIVMSGPSSASQGQAATYTVTLLDAYGNVATGYTGTIHFSSNDTGPNGASLPQDYTFTTADAGTRSFSVVFNDPGTFYLRVMDAALSLMAEEDGIVVT